jgi:hypothetical protein
VLNQPKLRNNEERELEHERKHGGHTVIDTLLPNALEKSGGPPFTQADFEAALKKVARKIEPEKSK